MALKMTTSFHSAVDSNVRALQAYNAKTGWGPIVAPIYTTYNFSLSYQFYPHFHPYVLQLAETLAETDSVFDLLAMNVLYQANPDRSLKAIPNSTRAVLFSVGGGAQLLDADQKPVLAGAPLTILDSNTPLSFSVPAATSFINPDGSAATLSAAVAVSLALPISIPNSINSGVSVTLPAGTGVIPSGSATSSPIAAATAVILPDETLVTLSKSIAAWLSDGTPVALPVNTQVLLRTGLPLPQQTPVKLYEQIFTASAYNPSSLVRAPYPVNDLDFSISGAYSIYNWELFFHAPLMIAIHLSQNQQFQDAQNWFHTIFDPTDDSGGPTPARFWKVRPFQYNDVEMIQQIMVNLSTGQDPQLQADTINSINAWASAPFEPFVVAQYRPTSFMLKTVMAYLDNLIAWGDSLFEQYTVETINEATQIYVLAANILGPKPQVVPVKESSAPQTYATIRPNLDQFSNALVEMEVDIPFDTGPSPAPAADPTGMNTLTSIGQSLFFCIPQNDTLLQYWDTVATRLFNIHNSLNIQGVYQKLPLFDPPIDPALLVRAAAEGLDINAIVSGLNQPLPLVRFQLLVAKATEICQEVKSLGASLLSALEKEDNEALTLLRAQHDSIIANLTEMVKYSQWQEAIKATQGLQQSLANATERYTYYQKLLGRTASQINVPSLDPIDAAGLQNLNFTQSDDSGEPAMAFDAINVDIASNSASVSDGEIKTLSTNEAAELNAMSQAQDQQGAAGALDLMGKELSLIPQFGGKVQPMGGGVDVTFGGVQLGTMMSMMAGAVRLGAEELAYGARLFEKLGSFSRREQEWTYQSNLAEGEINQVMKQLRAAQIREAIAKKEYENHQVQMQQAADIESFLKGSEITVDGQGSYRKTTTVGFYLWMKGALQSLYSNSFQLAFSVARKAEQALQHELGDSSLSYIQSNYLDGMEGLLAGEKMLYDVKRMEMAYLDLNVREYELTKHVSLLQVAPLALIQLRATGSCIVNVPEELFDLDGPGHYFRRIKSVAVTIPCVTGPYAGVTCTLALQNSSIRSSAQVQGAEYSDVKNLNSYYGAIQAVVTSSGQMDSGLFEANLHDERYLPFEYSGVISQWQLTLTADVPQFDFDTITDVILHIRYTAREGGQSLRAAALANLKKKIAAAQTVGSTRLFSLRHEFPTNWAKFKAAASGTLATLSFNLLPQHFPFWATKLGLKLGATGGVSNGIKGIEFFAEMANANPVDFYDGPNTGTAKKDSLKLDPSSGLMAGGLMNIALPPVNDPSGPPATPYTLYSDNNGMMDLWMAVTWPK
jgi:Tc toxin complex TcA C-terminal TcB-binding domain